MIACCLINTRALPEPVSCENQEYTVHQKSLLQCSVIITRSIFLKIRKKTSHRSPIRARYGMYFFVQTLSYTLSQPLQWCIPYYVILDQVIMALDCILFVISFYYQPVVICAWEIFVIHWLMRLIRYHFLSACFGLFLSTQDGRSHLEWSAHLAHTRSFHHQGDGPHDGKMHSTAPEIPALQERHPQVSREMWATLPAWLVECWSSVLAEATRSGHYLGHEGTFSLV